MSWIPEDIEALPTNRLTERPENKLARELMEMSDFNRNLDEYKEKLDTFAFAMYRYKTSWCPKIGQKHDWAQWIYAHRLQDFRRPPDIYEYEPEDCHVIVHKDCSWESWREGLYCKYSHTTFERLYHPSKFKVVPCEKKVWNREEMCAFYHKPEEKNQAEYESANYVDPFAEEYYYDEAEGEYSHNYEEGEWDSEEVSHESRKSNTNIITQELGENDSETMPNAKLSVASSDKFPFEDANEQNAWANDEFGLEDVLKRTKSQAQSEDFEVSNIENDSSSFPPLYSKEESLPGWVESSNVTEDKETEDSSKRMEIIDSNQDTKPNSLAGMENEKYEVSKEIKSIALGNNQRMETSEIVHNILSNASPLSKSKFFNINEENTEKDGDFIDEIMNINIEDSKLLSNNQKLANTSLFNPYQQEITTGNNDMNGFNYNVLNLTEDYTNPM